MYVVYYPTLLYVCVMIYGILSHTTIYIYYPTLLYVCGILSHTTICMCDDIRYIIPHYYILYIYVWWYKVYYPTWWDTVYHPTHVHSPSLLQTQTHSKSSPLQTLSHTRILSCWRPFAKVMIYCGSVCVCKREGECVCWERVCVCAEWGRLQRWWFTVCVCERERVCVCVCVTI